MNPPSLPPVLGVVIRFKNSAATLPAVLEALRRQTVQPDLILGVNSGSTDHSEELLRAAGARVIEWSEPYHHSRVLNFALRHCPAELVLVLSSHTVLRSPDAIAQMVSALADPQTACASARWDEDPFYSGAIDFQELRTKGLKFGSIYSNSMGMLRRSLWEQTPFDEALVTMEDGAWALEQMKRGYSVRRLNFDFDYARSGKDRTFTFALVTFKLAARHGLHVTWLGFRGTVMTILSGLAAQLFSGKKPARKSDDWRVHLQRLWAALCWRWRSFPRHE